MRLYVQVTCVLFALIVAAHIARIFTEDMALARDPAYIGITAFAVGMCVWGVLALRKRA
jgi:hypothetical protein